MGETHRGTLTPARSISFEATRTKWFAASSSSKTTRTAGVGHRRQRLVEGTEIRTEFGRSEEGRWTERYGFVEHTVGRDDGDSLEDGRTSRRRKYRKVIRERPGLAPAALFHLIGNSVFLRLSDVASGLPPDEERVLLASMDTDSDATGLSQRSGYDRLFETLRAALADALSKGSRRLLATYLQTLLAYPDGCTRGEAVFDPESEELLVQVPPLPEERLYPKEQALIDLVAAERLQGRRVLVYATHTGTRDITGRMDSILTRHGFRVAVMKADAVPPERREAWVAKRVEEGVDVLVCHPRLVQTGLDLVDFPMIVWFETEVSVFQSTPNAALLVGAGVASTRRIVSRADVRPLLPAQAGQVLSAGQRRMRWGLPVASSRTHPAMRSSRTVTGRSSTRRKSASLVTKSAQSARRAVAAWIASGVVSRATARKRAASSNTG